MTLNEEGLIRWGSEIGRLVATPVFLCLRGALGAGKSVLARAIGAGAGVTAAMPSPSFNLLFRYPTNSENEVVHLDLYRIESANDLRELGWGELGAPDEIVIVEWPEHAGSLLPRDYWIIDLSVPVGQPDLRNVQVHRFGNPPELPGFPMSVSGP
jgi:tRNA threonylcarbamoyladenosine biosynthesis protein TsaE